MLLEEYCYHPHVIHIHTNASLISPTFLVVFLFYIIPNFLVLDFVPSCLFLNNP